MVESLVNVVLLVAVLVLLIAWAVNAGRRRRRDRREHAAQRRLIVAALSGTAAPLVPAVLSEDGDPTHAHVARPSSAAVPTAPGQFDDAAVAALLDLLEDRHPVRPGVLANLFTSPRGVWSAGTQAGQSVGSRTVRDRHAKVSSEPDSDLCREAAAELVDIHTHDPADAHREYVRYAAALGDPVLAELYVRCAAYTTYPDHDEVLRVVGDVTGTIRSPKVSDDAATIET